MIVRFSFLLVIAIKIHHCTKTCYVHLGCLETNNSWFSPNRPFNPNPSSREQINTTFQLYTIMTRRDGDAVFTDYETFATKNFFKTADRNFFIIHGFLSWGKADWIMDIKDELLKIYGQKANVFSIDWSGHGLDYAQTAVNARVVGLEVSKFINKILLKELGLSTSTIHIIGHSLGAHVAGYIGEKIPNILRITGLDPAGQHFAGMPSYVRLDPSDAVFVDVIHSDTQGYGTNRPMGHVDFYANDEGAQPGCGPLNMFPQFINQGMNATLQEAGTCSHSRSHQYLIESLLNFNNSERCQIVAYRCSSYGDVENGKCIDDCNPYTDYKCMLVGLNARRIPNEKNVIMYFRTNGYRPFCLTPYNIYVDVISTSVPVLYTIVVLTVFDSKGAAISWTFNDGNPLPVQSRTGLYMLVFSSAVLTLKDLNAASVHWNSRFYAFGLLRRALVNGFIKIGSISVTTIDRKRIKLCPRVGESGIDVFENEEVMFYANMCNLTISAENSTKSY